MPDRPAHPDPSADREAVHPTLDGLLDAALQVDAPPGLAERVLARTPRVAATAPAEAVPRSAVVARIGPARLSAALALPAGPAIAATFAWWQPWTHAPAGPSPGALATLHAELDTLARAEALTREETRFDRELDTLSLQLAMVQTSDPWADPEAAMTEAAAQHAVEAWADDLPLLF